MSAEPAVCAVLGSGTMGAQIALSLALGGATVRLWGRRAEAVADAAARCRTAFEFVEQEGLTEDDAPSVLDRIAFGTELNEAIDGAGFVIEAVAEDLALKQRLLGEAEAVSADRTVLSSTTSALGATDLQSGLRRPERFCIAHYAQPAHLVALVEVVPGARTDEQTVDFTTRLLAATGKTPVRCPDVPGFLWARIQHAVLRELSTLVGRGLVTPEACDTVLRKGYATRLPAMGAFEHADLAGLDLMNGEAARAVWADLSCVKDPADTPVGTLFSDGHTGMKSGRGFYDWRMRDPEEFKRQRDAEIVRRIKIEKGGTVQ